MSDQSLVVDDNEAAPLQMHQESVGSVSPLVAMLASGQLKAEHVSQALELQQKHDKHEAEKAYNQALAEFRKRAPTLKKDKLVSYSSKGGNTAYSHTSLGYGMSEVNPILGECDLNLSWRPSQRDGMVFVTARLSHALGHYEEVELFCAPDASGQKNAIQAVSSAITYLKRVTGFAILGLASVDDDDGRATGAPVQQQSTQGPLQYNIKQLKQFNDAINNKDGFALIELAADNDTWIALFNSFGEGQKVVKKETVRKSMAEAREIIASSHKELINRMESDDKPGAVEILEETPWRFIAPLADDQLKNWIGTV